MKNVYRLLPALTMVVALLLSSQARAGDAGSVNLRPVWQVGQTARYDYWSKTVKDETAEFLGKTQTKQTTFVSEGQILWVVDVVNEDGSSACTMKFEKMKFSMTVDDSPALVVDSENPSGENAVFESLIKAMTDTPLSVKVRADGSIESVEGVDELEAAAGKDAREADVIPEEIDFIETASEMATLIACPAQATSGQTWNTKNTWNHDSVVPGAKTKSNWDTTFTFAGLGEIAGIPVATIKADASVDFDIDLSKMPQQTPGIDVQFGDAQAKGEILFDLSRHETVARNDSLKYQADVTIAPPNDKLPPFKVKVIESSQSQLLRVSEQ